MSTVNSSLDNPWGGGSQPSGSVETRILISFSFIILIVNKFIFEPNYVFFNVIVRVFVNLSVPEVVICVLMLWVGLGESRTCYKWSGSNQWKKENSSENFPGDTGTKVTLGTKRSEAFQYRYWKKWNTGIDWQISKILYAVQHPINRTLYSFSLTHEINPKLILSPLSSNLTLTLWFRVFFRNIP